MILFEAFAWFWIGLGVLSGAIIGSSFRREDYLGGYGSWPRRLIRLGHIAFFGAGMLCLLMSGTLHRFPFPDSMRAMIVAAMTIGAIGMPLICSVAAFRPKATPLFVIPVLAIGTGVTITYAHLIILWTRSGSGTLSGAFP